ncbi:riboflavin kinase [Pieris rapae]|uniref:riboflavin kinase n=1 Tax=Pieris rapae TaxID=64459 RepID=UPI000B929362|nr:riboflavin kinase [Pieris rapae]
MSYLPFFIKGEVVKGFGRGSKDLGCPTANFSREVIKCLPKDFKSGVYCGWAQVDSQPVYKMVVNIGWCPVYQNEDMSVETHIIHEFESDFYGSTLKICITEYLRPEMNFTSLDGLIKQISLDINNAHQKLALPEFVKLKSHEFFSNGNN